MILHQPILNQPGRQGRQAPGTGEGRPRRLAGAALLLLLLIAAGCGTPASSPPPAGPGATAAVFSGSAGAAVGSGLRALADGYSFTSTVTVGDEQTTEAHGRWIGGTGEFVVSSGGTAITYRTVPPQAWVRGADGAWAEVSGTPPGDPLAALLEPVATEASGDDPAGRQIRASYDPATLGLSGTDPVTVTLALDADGTVVATYEVPTSGGPATSRTVFSRAIGQAPIVPPSAVPSASPG